jgi:DNA polymerase/3'-5' exonuclease PolX
LHGQLTLISRTVRPYYSVEGITMNNHLISQKLLAHARNLHGGANLFRVRSYRHAAIVIDGLNEPVAEILSKRGRSALARLPGIGEHLAYTIEMLLQTGTVVPHSRRHRETRVA